MKTLLRLFLFALIISSSFTATAQCLNGNYTIGGTSPDYVTINDAVSALTVNGVCGPVFFNIRSGIYNEQINLPAITGSSALNRITFQSEVFDSTAVIVTWSPTSIANYTWQLNGADYITICLVTLKATGASYATALRIDNGVINNIITNNVLEGTATVLTSPNMAVVYENAGTNTNNQFNQNRIFRGSTGLYYNTGTGIVIQKNTFVDQYYKAIELVSTSSVQVLGNTINSLTAYTSFIGIDLLTCDAGIKVLKNKISLGNGIYGINLNTCTGNVSNRGLVANNFIHLGSGSGTGYGVYTVSSNYHNIYYNSINNQRTGTGSRCYYQGGTTGSGNLQVQNNIFSASGGGYAYYVDQIASINVSNYNDLYTTGANIGFWTANRTTLSAWQSASGKDVNSKSINPEFVSNSDLHIQAYLLDNQGFPVAEVVDDIDGITRSLSIPDIGASEWTAPANDAGVTSIDQALTYCISNDSVYVSIKNFGTANLTTVTINWSVNGITQTPKAWTGNLVQGAVQGPFSIGYYNFGLGTTYSIIAYTSNPNGSPEGYTHNDQASVSPKYQAMSGTYTIGGATPDYSTINLAVTDLVNGGVCGPVTFLVRDGIYNEQISISAVAGTSSVNTVTFRSQSNDSTGVIVTSTPSSTNNYTWRINTADYINLEKMTIRALGSTYSTALRIENNSNNNRFSSCILEGSTTTSTSANLATVYKVNISGNNNIFENNIVLKGSTGIYYYGTATGIIIRNNTLTDQYYKALELGSLTAVKVNENQISSSTTYTSFIAIDLNSCSNAIQVLKNKISMGNGVYGISINTCNGTSGLRGLIANNFIHLGTGSGTGYALYVVSSNYQNIYYNSINIQRSGTGSRAFYQGGTTGNGNIQVQNNIFAATGGGYAYYVDQIASINVSDYNNLYTTGANIGFWTANRTTLSAWQSATSKDANSSSINPEFVSNSDLHARAYLMDDLGFSLPEVNDDIDGLPRSLTTPDMGASEWTTPVNDAGVTSIDQGLTYCISNDSVYVSIKNYGTANLTSATINWSVNGISQTPYSWSGNLAQGGVQGPFSVGFYNFSLGTAYAVIAYTSNPNGSAEGFTYNDQASVAAKYKAMSGNYTVGGTTPDYATIGAAVTDLVNGGVCGPVTFLIRDGVYNEQVSVDAFAGASSLNTVTFRSQSSDSTGVIITYTPTSTNNYTWRFNGCDHVILCQVTVRALGSTYANAIRIENGSINNIITNNIVEGSTTTSTSTNFAVIFENTGTNTGNQFTWNVIQKGSTGLYYNAGSSIQIRDNIFQDQYYKAMELVAIPSVQITGNTITSSTTYTSYIAMDLNTCDSGIKILKNKISVGNGIYGVYLNTCTGNISNRGLIANNFIHLGSGSGTGYALHAVSTNYLNVYYNTINIQRSGTGSRAFYQGGTTGSGNIQVQNNIFAATGGGYAYYVDQIASINVSNYNNLYTTGANVGFYTANRTNLAAWQSATSKDVNSVSIDPEFVSNSDLHLQAYLLDNLGFPVAEVNDDIDGLVRGLSTPDMGASEWTTPLNDAGVTSIDQALTYCITNDSVFVSIKNYGTSNLTSVTVNWSVNGISQSPYSWTGNLAQGGVQGPFSIGYYNFNLGTSYSIIAYTSNPNGTPEGFTHNDQASVSPKYKAMSGTYTIGGTSPNYANLNLAVTDLVNGGVCGPVTFLVRDGIYNEQVSIGTVAGTSAINKVVFRSLSNDSTAVIITYTPTSTNNYTWRLNACDYITLEKMTIRALGSTYSTALRIENSSDNNLINSCILEGSTTTSTSSNLAVVFKNGTTGNNNIFSSNMILKGSTGIYYFGTATGISFSKNNFSNQYYKGLELGSLTSVQVTENEITTNTTYTSFIAMDLNSCSSAINVSRNKISMGNGVYGIYLNTCTGTSGARGVIANNFIHLGTGAGTGYALYVVSSNYQNIYYNSIHNQRSGTGSRAFYQGGTTGSGNIQVQNNIFSASAGGYAYYVDQIASINVSNYNDIYTTGTNIGFYTANRTNLAAWQTATGKDVNSKSVNPAFVSNSDLHTSLAALSGAGSPVSGVTNDIDNDPRNPSTPDIGADEFSNSAPPVSAFTASATTICAGSQVTFTDNSNGAPTGWSWTFTGGNPSFSSAQNPVITYSVPGTYDVILVASNNNGSNSLTKTNYIIVVTTPAQPGVISGSTTVCQSASQSYSISSVIGATSYVWTLPSGWGGSSSTETINVTAGSAGGNIMVAASNVCGTSGTQSLNISVSPTPPQPSAIVGSSNSCGGASLTYSVPVVSGATGYTWTLPSGWSGSSTSNVISVTTGSNSGTISVSASNSCGNGPATTLVITIDTTPVQPGTISGNATLCQGATQLYSIVPVSGASSYIWTLPSGWSGSSTSNSINATASSNSGLISVTAVNSCGSSMAQTYNVTVNQIPAQPGSITGNPTVCPGASLSYSINAIPGATSYSWTLPGGWGGSSTSTIINAFSGTTGGIISVSANNACGASSTQTISVSVENAPAQPGSISGNLSICDGSLQIYSVNPVSGATSYIWSMPSGWTGSSTANNIVATAGSNGGTISVVAVNSCGTSTAQTALVTVFGAPSTPSITLNGSVLSSTLASSYQWYLNGNLIPGAIAQTYTPTQNGNYTVSIDDSNGCQAISAVFNVTNVGINEALFSSIKIYPNPSIGELIIEASGGLILGSEVKLTDLSGRVVNFSSQSLSGSKLMIDFTEISSGIYVLEIRKENEIRHFRLVKN